MSGKPIDAADCVPQGVQEALQRLIENAATLGPASREDALLVARHRALALTAAQQQPEARVYQCPRCATSMEVDLTAKPEARGVVDELRRTVAAIGVVGEYLGKDTILRESVLDLIDRRLTALTGERNG